MNFPIKRLLSSEPFSIGNPGLRHFADRIFLDQNKRLAEADMLLMDMYGHGSIVKEHYMLPLSKGEIYSIGKYQITQIRTIDYLKEDIGDRKILILSTLVEHDDANILPFVVTVKAIEDVNLDFSTSLYTGQDKRLGIFIGPQQSINFNNLGIETPVRFFNWSNDEISIQVPEVIGGHDVNNFGNTGIPLFVESMEDI